MEKGFKQISFEASEMICGVRVKNFLTVQWLKGVQKFPIHTQSENVKEQVIITVKIFWMQCSTFTGRNYQDQRKEQIALEFSYLCSSLISHTVGHIWNLIHWTSGQRRLLLAVSLIYGWSHTQKSKPLFWDNANKWWGPRFNIQNKGKRFNLFW